MFGWFDSKNQKVVKRWEREHVELVELATKVIEAYSKGDEKKVRTVLKELSGKTAHHLMSEDLEFFKMMKDQKRMTAKTEALIKEFKESFSGVKVALMSFLKNYAEEGSTIDDKFFTEFNAIVDVLGERIKFEEDNLYIMLHVK